MKLPPFSVVNQLAGIGKASLRPTMFQGMPILRFLLETVE